MSRENNFLILSELPGKIASFIGRNADSFRGFTANSIITWTASVTNPSYSSIYGHGNQESTIRKRVSNEILPYIRCIRKVMWLLVKLKCMIKWQFGNSIFCCLEASGGSRHSDWSVIPSRKSCYFLAQDKALFDTLSFFLLWTLIQITILILILLKLFFREN